jgi:hypothetical protein
VIFGKAVDIIQVCDGLANGQNAVTSKTCKCVVQDCTLNISTKTQCGYDSHVPTNTLLYTIILVLV